MPIGPGSRIGPYEITALIGEGGMGEVWRAHHTALRRDDALKVLPDAVASTARARMVVIKNWTEELKRLVPAS
jgi:serine/threonine protein kinase